MGFEKRLLSPRYADDGISMMPLNVIQEAEISRFRERLLDGTYRWVTVTACAICGCREGYIVAEKDRYGNPMDTVLCANCGLLYTKDLLDSASLKRFYSEQYRDMYEGKHFALDEAAMQAYWESLGIGPRLARNIARASGLRTGATVLEIGTGGGWNLQRFHAMGFRVIGYDLDATFLEAGRARGLDLRQGGTKEAITAGDRADIVLLFDVIEHLDEPVEELERIAAILGDGGHVFIKTAGLRAALYGKAEGDILGYLQNAHTYLFERRTLEMLMRKAGYRTVTCSEQIFGLFRLDPILPRPDFANLGRGAGVLRTCQRIERMQWLWTGLHRWMTRNGEDHYYRVLFPILSYLFSWRYYLAVIVKPTFVPPRRVTAGGLRTDAAGR